MHTPPSTTLLMHPLLLHSFFLAPCLMHTPPFRDWFRHPSLLHCFLFAPCLMQTPPLMTWFVHPSLLHLLRLIFAPCLMHTPPTFAWFVHPSAEHVFGLHVFLYFRLYSLRLALSLANSLCSDDKSRFLFVAVILRLPILYRCRWFTMNSSRSHPSWSCTTSCWSSARNSRSLLLFHLLSRCCCLCLSKLALSVNESTVIFFVLLHRWWCCRSWCLRLIKLLL